MKLLRYGPRGQEKPGVLDASGAIRDLSGVVSDIDSATLAAGGLAKLKGVDPASLPKAGDSPRIGACVGGIGKVICIGLNYSDHAAETGAAIPKEPIVFMKATSAVQGPDDDVHIPRTSKKTDWEVELGVIIGKTAKYVSEADALNYVAGYCVANDVSEREFQAERGGQWTKGKSCDTFGPIGPWFVTADEVADPQNLDMFCDVNGKRMQNGSTKTMIFPVKHIIHYLSQMMSLHPGDVIMTGTPPGVGLGIKPTPVFLKAGDTMKLGITGLGEQNQKLVAD
ncbi:2-hydroxyhepta-2,4-diene-1,7-dioate isomerase [alpha proteobacterium BAL199]|jgi:2-keto-4-pentenoate hydratase/2-oxohepta-3-ene-1,7-dioic acid hydratase in catechol pathway|nr:2-hydroxyhepta-2,4-diene-1,7-dioate isomerase [alpha proteobacterium BAL199]